MANWREFEVVAPELAAKGRTLIYQFAIGLGYLATVRRDGGPRVHPICPIVYESGLYGLIGPSPKRRDLLRDGRYAIHSFPSPEQDDEFYLTGERGSDGRGPRASVRRAMTTAGIRRAQTGAEFDIERCSSPNKAARCARQLAAALRSGSP
jgi:hypothetical protein